jgi:hypothetical protein
VWKHEERGSLTGLVKVNIPLLGGLQTIVAIGAVVPNVSSLMASMALHVMVPVDGGA